MNDVTRIFSGDLVRSPQSTSIAQRDTLDFSKPGRSPISGREQAALQRLDGALRQGDSLDREVPRGTYLNITV